MQKNTDRCRSNLRKCGERSVAITDDGSPALKSNSYTVPGNHFGLKYEELGDEVSSCKTEYEHRLSKQDSFIRLENLKTPLEPILRTDHGSKQIQREWDTSTLSCHQPDADIRPKHGIVLPDIGLNAFMCCDKRTEEIKEALDQVDFQYIRHTRSGIAYNFMYRQPTAKPRRLPKIVSDGAMLYGRKEGDTDTRSSVKLVQRQKLRVNGEELSDKLRSSANRSRLKRKNRNLVKSKCQLQMQEGWTCRLGIGSRAIHTQSVIGDNAVRIREMSVKQDEIREKEHIQNMTRIMKQMKRH